LNRSLQEWQLPPLLHQGEAADPLVPVHQWIHCKVLKTREIYDFACGSKCDIFIFMSIVVFSKIASAIWEAINLSQINL